MSTVDEIKEAIETLPEGDYNTLRKWFAEMDWGKWDQEIELDAAAGKLDFLIDEAETARANGTLRDL